MEALHESKPFSEFIAERRKGVFDNYAERIKKLDGSSDFQNG